MSEMASERGLAIRPAAFGVGFKCSVRRWTSAVARTREGQIEIGGCRARRSALASGDRVELRGFGIFEAKVTKARTGRNPATGESIQIAASQKATFRPSKELKGRLHGK